MEKDKRFLLIRNDDLENNVAEMEARLDVISK
jgi:hypothetical protein